MFFSGRLFFPPHFFFFSFFFPAASSVLAGTLARPLSGLHAPFVQSGYALAEARGQEACPQRHPYTRLSS
jgi:hypothetical protein